MDALPLANRTRVAGAGALREAPVLLRSHLWFTSIDFHRGFPLVMPRPPSRMERFNLTTRMTLRRFTRLTNGHSKKNRNPDTMLGHYFAWYNFCRNHSSIKTTPAMKAGIVSEKWTLERPLTMAAA